MTLLPTVTTTGGRRATTRRIAPRLALGVGMPSAPAPAGWRWVRLTDVARLESGHTPSRRHPEWWGGAIPWLSLKDAKAHHGGRIVETSEHTNGLGIANSSARVLPKDTVCLSRTASVGYVVVMDRPMATSQDFVSWVCSDDIEPDYVKYLFLAEGPGLLRFAAGAVHSTIYFPEVKAFHVALPPRPEQQRIVGALDEAFTDIAMTQENAKRNLRNARAVFENHLNAVFSARRPNSLTPIADVAEVFDGPHATPKTVLSGPIFLGISALQDGFVNLNETRHVTPADFATWTRRVRPQTDDVVFSYETRLGQAAIIPDGLDCCLGRRMGLVRLNRDRVNPRFFVYQYISPPFRRFLESRTIHGATVDRIAVREFPTFQVWLPDLNQQNHITSALDALRVESRRLERLYERKLAALEELRRSLLHQAFTGRLTKSAT